MAMYGSLRLVHPRIDHTTRRFAATAKVLVWLTNVTDDALWSSSSVAAGSLCSRYPRRTPRSPAAHALEKRVTRLVANYVHTSAPKPNPRRVKRKDSRTLRQALDEFLREFVFDALQRHRNGRRWNVAGTARALDIDRGRLQRMIDRLNIRPGKRGARR